MGKNDLKSFALRARNNLIEQVAQRAALFGISKDTSDAKDTAKDTGTVPMSLSSVAALRRDVAERGFDRVVEDVACVLFNRLTCLWYMEVNGYLPAAQDLADMIPLVFGDSLGYERLLLPDTPFRENPVVRDMAENLDREDFVDNVQVTGWLYQYFISPRKDGVYEGLRNNKKIASEDIPAATQLFTPDWVVKYMVENSLGRLWLDTHPDSTLRRGWRYYIDEAKQPAVISDRLRAATGRGLPSPESIRVMDPAMGSGNMLVYAFDLLYDIYLSEGYKKDRVPGLIIKNNLYGLDIDDRAAGLACFALMMKARSKDRDFFGKGIRPNLFALKESGGLTAVDVMPPKGTGHRVTIPEGCMEDMDRLLAAFRDARELGSVINLPDMDLERLHKWWEGTGRQYCENGDGPGAPPPHYDRVLGLINQARAMKRKYHVVITNPPYMGIRGMNPRLAGYLSAHYKHSKHDLFTVFMELALRMTMGGGCLALINQHSWMFLSSYRRFREEFLGQCCLCSMLHLGSGVFEGNVGTIVQSTAFVARRVQVEGYSSVFIDLQHCGGSNAKEGSLLDLNSGCGKAKKYTASVSGFGGIPGKPIAYWAHESIIRAFADNKKLGDIAKPRQGMATSDNKRFVRYWYEVPFQDIGFGCCSTEEAFKSGRRWFPYNKGGVYRKWYGNNSMVVDWKEDGREIKELAASLYGNHTRTIKNIRYYFREAITYTFISTNLGARYSPPGFIFDVAGSSIFAPERDLYVLLAFLCSKLSRVFLEILNPTFNIQVGDIKNLPIVEIKDDSLRETIGRLARENVEISKTDWDFKEISWDFKGHPLIEYKEGAGTIEYAYSNWCKAMEGMINRLRSNEEELNDIFIRLYGLQDVVSPEVDEGDITIKRPNREETIKSFISYAVGCMFGRFCPDAEGVMPGKGPFHGYKHKGFSVKEDNIIPVSYAGCFKDNLASRFTGFVEAVFGAKTLEQNLDYVARSLGKRQGETAREAIGRYFETLFYKDHLSMYNRRPVYWLFDSGRKKGFKALVYLHRYDISTLSVMRERYLGRAIEFYRKKLAQNDRPVSVDGEEKRLEECLLYDRALCQAIRKGISISPDEGVLNNYAKFQSIPVPGRVEDRSLRVNLLAQGVVR